MIAMVAVVALGAAPGKAVDADRFITLASTTSTRNSGLLDVLLPRFAAETGIEVRAVVVGTGQALRLARRGDADVLMVHDTASEEEFVSKGYGLARHPLMHNDFVIVGPADDPAGIGRRGDAPAALARIAKAQTAFVSRGDDSGTHKAEMRLWDAAGVDPSGASGRWYRETGSGMGATLNTAAAMGAYTLADRASWIAFANRRQLVLWTEGDPRLYNPYGVIVVDPARHPHVKAKDAQTFVDWLLSERGQKTIADFRVEGQALFFPDAIPDAGD